MNIQTKLEYVKIPFAAARIFRVTYLNHTKDSPQNGAGCAVASILIFNHLDTYYLCLDTNLNMKKIISIIAICIIVLGMLSLTVKKGMEAKQQLPELAKAELNSIPQFAYLNTEKEIFSNLHLETGISTIVIHFSPTCDFCDDEAQIILNYYNEFRNSQVLFASNHKLSSINEFALKHNLNGYPNIHFLQYQDNAFLNTFGLDKLPCIFVFDTQGKLLKKIEEKVSARTLIKYTRAANDR